MIEQTSSPREVSVSDLYGEPHILAYDRNFILLYDKYGNLLSLKYCPRKEPVDNIMQVCASRIDKNVVQDFGNILKPVKLNLSLEDCRQASISTEKVVLWLCGEYFTDIPLYVHVTFGHRVRTREQHAFLQNFISIAKRKLKQKCLARSIGPNKYTFVSLED